MANLSEIFAEQRAKYEKQREDARASLEEAEAELRALTAYETAKRGTPLPSTDGPKRTRKPRESGKRKAILDMIEAEQEGLTRADLIGRLGVKGDKQAETALSNALSALKRGGQVTLENGIYRAQATGIDTPE